MFTSFHMLVVLTDCVVWWEFLCLDAFSVNGKSFWSLNLFSPAGNSDKTFIVVPDLKNVVLVFRVLLKFWMSPELISHQKVKHILCDPGVEMSLLRPRGEIRGKWSAVVKRIRGNSDTKLSFQWMWEFCTTAEREIVSLILVVLVKIFSDRNRSYSGCLCLTVGKFCSVFDNKSIYTTVCFNFSDKNIVVKSFIETQISSLLIECPQYLQ